MLMKENMKKNKDKLLLLPLIFAVGYLPLLLCVHFYDPGISAYDWAPAWDDEEADLFLWIKMVAMIVTGAVMLVILIIHLIRTKLSLNRFQKIAIVAILFYAAMVVSSAAISEQRYQAFFGSFEMFESVFFVLACLTAFFYAMVFVREENIRFILIGAAPGLILLSILCILQAFGLNFLDLSFIRYLITPAEYWSDLSQYNFSASLSGGYGTLYNPNYVLPFFGFVFFTALALCRANRKHKAAFMFCAAAAVLSLAAILSSGSKTAVITIPITFLLGAVMIINGKRRLFVIPITAGLAGIVFVFLSLSYGGADKLLSVISESFSPKEKNWQLENMVTAKEGVRMTLNGHELFLSYEVEEEGEAIAVDLLSDGEELPLYSDEEGIIYIDDPEYENLKLIPYEEEGLVYISVAIGKKTFDLCDFGTPDGYLYRNPFGKFVKTRKIENVHLFPERFLTWRGGLWNRTIPLLKKNLFLGSGSNNFLYVYPQDDYVYKVNRGGRQIYALDVKPHSIFLQQWVENGFPALLALIVFYAVYLIWSVRLYRKTPAHDPAAALGLGVFLGSLNYVTAGFTTDSNVNTAPIFWCCLGTGFAVNAIISDRRKEENVV